MRRNFPETLFIVAQLVAYVLGGYMLHNNMDLNEKLTGLNDKISSVNTKIESHLEWHRGKEKV